MNIKLLHATPLFVCMNAIRECWDNHDKSDDMGKKDKSLIFRVANMNKHGSTLRHLNYSFSIKGISRGCLQELVRHSHAEPDSDSEVYIPNSPTVKSSRYTLHELKDEEPFYIFVDEDTDAGYKVYFKERAAKYIVFTGDDMVDFFSIVALEGLRLSICNKIKPDVAKYCMPDAYKTNLTWTINAQALQNFLNLRTARGALAEIRILANNIYNELPDDHKYLFSEFNHTND